MGKLSGMRERIRKRNVVQAAALICVAVVLCCFVARKEGYHMDELLSFELANAQFNP